MCKFSFQEAANCALCSILSASYTTFAVWMPEEDVQDFRQLRPGLDSPQVVGLLLCAELALHRCLPHPGKFLSDKVFPFFLLEVVSVVGSGITGISSHSLCFNCSARMSCNG